MTQLIALLALAVAALPFGSRAALAAQEPDYVEGRILVKFRSGASPSAIRGMLDARHFAAAQSPLVQEMNLYLVQLKGGLKVADALRQLSRNPNIVYAQADHKLAERNAAGGERIPSDPQFSKQWSMYSPSTQVDISAPAAWGLGTGGKTREGEDIVVAIVDGGMDIAHPDLVANLWKNPGEIAGNGKDDDGNGYIDDVNGWNAFSKSGSIPSASHGTHVAGIAGASGDNNTGVTGVNWSVKIMPVAASSGTTSVVAAGYGYVLAQKKAWLGSRGAKGANVVVTNSSFGVDLADCRSGEYPIWNDLYDALGKAGILSAAATANRNIDVDVKGDVPTGCGSPYIVSVTNTTAQDGRNSGAAYGAKSVDLGAPGTSIISTLPGGSTGPMTGTSMATPHVAGAIAFLHSVASKDLSALVKSSPAEGALQIKAALLDGVDKIPSMQGVTVSGGRLNLHKAGQLASRYEAR